MAPALPSAPRELLILDGAAVRRLLQLPQCMDIVRDAMIALSEGGTQQLLRQIIDLGPETGFSIMPGAMPEMFGAKLLSARPASPAQGIRSHEGVIVLFERESALPVAIIDAAEVTRLRTAAASALATKALARPEARRLAILGTGDQAEWHARAIAGSRELDDVAIWGRSTVRAAALAARLQPGVPVPVRAATNLTEAVGQADIICTTTASMKPILTSDMVRDGAHLNVVGSSRLGPREIDDALVARSLIFADHLESAYAQGAEIVHARRAGLIAGDHIMGEIGAVFGGRLQGRRRASDVTLYKSLGLIVQDLSCGQALYQAAIRVGEGHRAPIRA